MKTKSTSQFGFFNPRFLIGVVLCFVGLALAFVAFRTASAQGNSPSPQVRGEYQGLLQVVHFDVSPRLSDMKPIPPGPCTMRENEDRDIVPWKVRFSPDWDPVVQRSTRSGINIPGPIVTFDGATNLCGCSPPDPNGEVGPNHIVVMANLHFQIFNKTGTSLFGPAANNTLWSGFGGPCQTSNSGDPVVLYDQLADRWLLSQFTATSAPFFNCVAISTSPDPTGTYFRYAIITGTTGANFPDYPKYGVWPDAYYLSTREFLGSSGPFQGVGAYALNRAQMLVGTPNPQVIFFIVPPVGGGFNVGDGLLPADLDGTTLPPAGSDEYYLGTQDNNGPNGAPSDALNLYKFHVDFGTPVNSSFILANTIPTAPFNSILGLCGGTRACIPQPGTANKIDHLGYRQRPLHRLAYRNFGTHESLVTNQSVSGGTGPNGEVSGIRWWELRSPNVAPVIFQEGTYAPGVTDGIHRWMGSIAMDGLGNMALGYSASNGTSPSVFPSVFYTGRLAGDPPGTMPQGEGSIKNGTGSQTGSNRWGDYTALSVDPTDDLTFWYVNEYVPTTSSIGWRLRIGSFKLSNAPVPTGVVSRKLHGGIPYDIPLPVVPVGGNIGIECRTTGGTNDYQVVATFGASVTAITTATVTPGLGGTGSVSGAPIVNGNEVTVNLTNVSNLQRLTVNLIGVVSGTNSGDVTIPMGMLIGDTDASGGVDAADVSQAKMVSGQTTTAVNFRTDVNATGGINAADVGLVKSKAGNVLPP